jgi:prevent-host-death family protein
MAWQLQDAKQKFSKLVRDTLEKGPQVVTRHGEEVVVVISADEFRRLSGKKPSFKEFLLSGPDFEELHLELERIRDLPQPVDL